MGAVCAVQQSLVIALVVQECRGSRWLLCARQCEDGVGVAVDGGWGAAHCAPHRERTKRRRGVKDNQERYAVYFSTGK